MNSQGYTKDNIHKGNTKIVAGGIDVDGLIRIGDQSAGGDGYVLPAVKGTEGQVLTMNADNTSSFEDAGGGVGTSRVLQNLFNMTNPSVIFNPSTFRPLYTNKNGSDIITTADIAVGGSVRFRTKGYLYNGTPGFTALGQFRLNIGVPNSSTTFDFYSNNGLFIRDVGMSASDPNVGRGWWEINITITKIDASNNCTIGVSGLYNCVASTGVTSDTFDIQFYDDPTTFTTRLPNNSSSNTISPIPFWNTLPSTFKLELAWKQTAFDANAIATEYTIDYCNVDTQVLTTTTAPATDHNTLANLNVGDPHSQYAKNGGRVGGQLIAGGLSGGDSLILKNSVFSTNNLALNNTDTRFEKNIDIGTNQILDGVNNSIDFVGGDMNFLNTSLTNRIVLASQNNIDILANNQIKLGVPNASSNIVITSTDTLLNQDLNMNNNAIVNAPLIDSTTSPLALNCGLGNSITLDGSFITFFQGGGSFVPSFTPSSFDMNNGGINDVSSINGFTPSGGVFAGTADSLTLTASTAEQSILPTSFVGTTAVPANGFKVGDSFHCVLAGDFGSNNGDTLTIRLKAGPTSTTILATLVVPLNNSSGSSFETEIDFQLRNIGSAGVADICSNFDFTYNQSGGGGAFVGERGVFQNNTTFDTTILNTLEITAQFSSTNASNTIKTIVSKLSKDF